MGVRSWWARRAVRATRVLVVEGGDGFVARVAVERAAAARGWRLAESPASADGLVVAGRRAADLHEVVERLWDAMPGPRARVEVAEATAAAAALDRLAAGLLDETRQVQDATSRSRPDLAAREQQGHEGMDHDGGHEGMDHDGMDHGGGHEGMDHGGMDMAPDGIPLAEGSEDDRDGLEMDALPVRLGPVLPHWPAGLVVDVTLHGDLVAEASAHLLDGRVGDDADEETLVVHAARRCDEVAAVLALAGWEEGSVLARAARDDLLDHEGGDARALLVELGHRVEHSRLLRWSLEGVGVVGAEDAERLGLPEAVVGDCRDRLLRLLDRAAAAARAYAGTAGHGSPSAPDRAPAVPATALGPLVQGHDLSVARLLVATLGSPAPAGREVRSA